MISNSQPLPSLPSSLFWLPCLMSSTLFPFIIAIKFLRMVGLVSQPRFPDEDLTGKVCIVTGCNTGIGKRTAFHLARMGGTIVMACRSKEKAIDAREEINSELLALSLRENSNISIITVDLSNTHSVREFCDVFRSQFQRLDILVNNAGINYSGKTSQGLDLTFASNFIGHFLLTSLLIDLITTTPGSRVVNLSSVMHRHGSAKWIDSMSAGKPPNSPFHMMCSYSDSKMAMIIFSYELRRRFQKIGNCTSTSFAVHPGAVFSDIWRRFPQPFKFLWDFLMKLTFLSADEGSLTSVHAAAAPVEKLGGLHGPVYRQPYFQPFNLPFPFEYVGIFIGSTHARVSLPKNYDELGQKLWLQTEAIIDLAEKVKRS